MEERTVDPISSIEELEAELERVKAERDAMKEEMAFLNTCVICGEARPAGLESCAACYGQIVRQREALREALQWIADQPCAKDAEGATEDTDCSETGTCITEWCLSCYAGKHMILEAEEEGTERLRKNEIKHECEDCGEHFQEDQEQCLICGGEVVPIDDVAKG